MNYILLDLDGTLSDPYQGISRCIIYALDKLGLPGPEKDALRLWIGPPLKSSFEAYFQSLGVADCSDKALALYRDRFGAVGLYENTLYPGIPKLLDDLSRAGFMLYVATAKPTVYAAEILRHFKLAYAFKGIYGSELDGQRGDKIQLLAYLLQQEQLAGPQGVMVGDRKHDMAAARHHGLKAKGVLWGYGDKEELIKAGAHCLFDSPAGLKSDIFTIPPAFTKAE